MMIVDHDDGCDDYDDGGDDYGDDGDADDDDGDDDVAGCHDQGQGAPLIN